MHPTPGSSAIRKTSREPGSRLILCGCPVWMDAPSSPRCSCEQYCCRSSSTAVFMPQEFETCPDWGATFDSGPFSDRSTWPTACADSAAMQTLPRSRTGTGYPGTAPLRSRFGKKCLTSSKLQRSTKARENVPGDTPAASCRRRHTKKRGYRFLPAALSNAVTECCLEHEAHTEAEKLRSDDVGGTQETLVPGRTDPSRFRRDRLYCTVM